MKAVVLLSKTFFAGHFREGQQTEFRAKVEGATKIHTIRSNYPYWEEKIGRAVFTGGVLSVRQWTAAPYRSRQEEIAVIPADTVAVQKLELRREKIRVNEPQEGSLYHEYTATIDGRDVDINELAANDGLTFEEFVYWFDPVFDKAEAKYPELKEVAAATCLDFAVIHFTKKRY